MLARMNLLFYSFLSHCKRVVTVYFYSVLQSILALFLKEKISHSSHAFHCVSFPRFVVLLLPNNFFFPMF